MIPVQIEQQKQLKMLYYLYANKAKTVIGMHEAGQ